MVHVYPASVSPVASAPERGAWWMTLLASRTVCNHGQVSILSESGVPGCVWLLRTGNAVSETEKMNSAFYLMLINSHLNSHMGLDGCPLNGLFWPHAAFWHGRPVGFSSLWKMIPFLSTWSPKTGQVWRIYWPLPQGEHLLLVHLAILS